MSKAKLLSQQSSANSDKTAERIFPASSIAVKSVGAELAPNPFDKLYGSRPFNQESQSDSLGHNISHEASQPLEHITSAESQVIVGQDGKNLDLAPGSDSNAKVSAVGTKEPDVHKYSTSQHGKAGFATSEVLLDRDSTKASEAVGEAIFTTQRFEHKVNSEGVNQILTGLDGHEIQACEDEQIHFPGAVQSFGVLITLLKTAPKTFQVQHVSENSFAVLGLTPKYLFGLKSFLEILPEREQEIFLDQVEFLEDSNSSDSNINSQNTSSQDLEANVSPEVFILRGRPEDPNADPWKCWTALHCTNANGNLIILEFEMQKDLENPLTFEQPVAVSKEDSVGESDERLRGDKAGMSGEGFGAFSEEDLLESTRSMARPIRRVRRSVLEGDDKGTVEIFAILSQVNEQLSAPTDLKTFLKVVVGLVKDITRFHRVMVYQFDEQWNGQVVAELVDWSQTKDLFMGLFFPATDIPAQARSMYKLNKTRVLYDREQVSARLVCRSKQILDEPLDMTHCFLRAMSPIHLKYLANMGVRASMSISIVAFGELWGLIACHTYGNTSMRCSFLIRKLCRLVGEQISHNVERLSYTSRLAARKMVYSATNTSLPGSSTATLLSKTEDLLALFEADAGMLSVGHEGKILGYLENSREAITLREYFRHKRFELITSSTDLASDFPDINYASSSPIIVGVLYIPLSSTGEEFILLFRRGQLKKVHWAGNPYEKILERNERHQGALLPRESFKTWSETVKGRCKAWTEEQIETAAVLCLVYSKFIGVWREKQELLQTSRLASILLTNVGHEVRTPLNAVINYLEIAMEGKLSPETRESLEKSHSASKSLVYVINDLLDLTKLEQGQELFKNEPFDLLSTIREAVSVYRSQAERHAVQLQLIEDPTMPRRVLGDQAKMRQIISNVTANALKHTKEGAVTVHTKVIANNAADGLVEAAIEIKDTGSGMSEDKLDALFDNFELVEHSDGSRDNDGPTASNQAGTGLGLAIVARVVRNMNGQLRAESKVGRGSVFTLIFNFKIPEDIIRHSSQGASQHESSTQLRQPKTISHDSRNFVSNQQTAGSLPHMLSPEVTTEAAKSNQYGDQFGPQRLGSAELKAMSTEAQKAEGQSPRLVPQSLDITNVDRNPPGQRFWPSNEEHARSMNKLANASRRLSNGSVSESLASMKDHMDRQSSNGSVINDLVNSLLGSSGGSGPQISSQDARSFVNRSGEAGQVSLSSTSAVVLANPNAPVRSSQPQAETRQSSENSAVRRVSSDSVPATSAGAMERVADPTIVPKQAEYPRPRYSQIVPTSMRAVKMDSDDVSVPERSQPGSSHESTSGNTLESVDSTNLNVLYAEDDAINRSIVQKRLRIDKHSVHLAHDGSECYDEFAKDTKKYDVILMDMQMPILDGMAATRKIRELEETCYAERKSRIPIIAVSASLTEGQAHDAIATGLDGWILKPVDFRRLRHLFSGLRDTEVRKQDFYETGKDYAWTRGGWLTLDIANKIGA